MTKVLGAQEVGRGLGQNVWLQGTKWVTGLTMATPWVVPSSSHLWLPSTVLTLMPALMHPLGAKILHQKAAQKLTDSLGPQLKFPSTL